MVNFICVTDSQDPVQENGLPKQKTVNLKRGSENDRMILCKETAVGSPLGPPIQTEGPGS
jgi:hypothetical protein